MNNLSTAISFLMLAIASLAQGATYQITSYKDLPAVNVGDGTARTEEGTVTLRSALQEANFHPGHDIIEFAQTLASSIQISDTLFITDDLTIKNTGFQLLHLISFGSEPFRFFYVEEQIHIEMRNIDVLFYDAPIEADIGAMMYVSPGAEVVLNGCRFYGGVANSYGGGIYLDRATAILLNGTVLSAYSRVDGGGLYNNEGTVVITGGVASESASQGNGGLFYNKGGTVIISGGGLGGGEAGGFGGVFYSEGGTVNVDGGRFGGGAATTGGGVYLVDGATLRMSRTNVQGNETTASGAGIHIESGSLVATQCSFSENATEGPGGGVYIAEGNSVSFVNCTFTANTAALGGGLYVSPGASATLGNTVLAGNTAQGEYADLWGNIGTLGHNLVGIAPTGLNAFLQGTVDNPLDPMLQYHELYPGTGRLIFLYIPEGGSPLIDAGDNALLSNPAFIGSQCVDAAGVSRLRNEVIDIGSTEFQGGTEQPSCGGHSADTQNTGQIDLSAVLRLIQLYNAGALHCDRNGEDGYAPGEDAIDQSCTPHSSDYNPQDWRIQLTELLRAIQLYNVGGYTPCPDANTEDGFCPNPPLIGVGKPGYPGSPPSEPYVRFSRIRLSGRWFTPEGTPRLVRGLSSG